MPSFRLTPAHCTAHLLRTASPVTPFKPMPCLLPPAPQVSLHPHPPTHPPTHPPAAALRSLVELLQLSQCMSETDFKPMAVKRSPAAASSARAAPMPAGESQPGPSCGTCTARMQLEWHPHARMERRAQCFAAAASSAPTAVRADGCCSHARLEHSIAAHHALRHAQAAVHPARAGQLQQVGPATGKHNIRHCSASGLRNYATRQSNRHAAAGKLQEAGPGPAGCRPGWIEQGICCRCLHTQ